MSFDLFIVLTEGFPEWHIYKRELLSFYCYGRSLKSYSVFDRVTVFEKEDWKRFVGLVTNAKQGWRLLCKMWHGS